MGDHAYDNVERRPAMDSEDQADEDLERTSAMDPEDQAKDGLERRPAMNPKDEANYDTERRPAMDPQDQTYDDFERWLDMDPELKLAACSGNVDFLRKAIASSKPKAYFLSRFKPKDDVEEPYAGNILHLAVWHCKDEFVEEALSKLPEEVVDLLLCQQETAGQLSNWNPLHVAVFQCNYSFVYLVCKSDFGVQEATEENGLGRLKESAKKLFTQQDSEGRTPALLAIQRRDYYTSETLVMGREKLIQGIVDNEGNSPLFLAVQNGLSYVVLCLLKECPDNLPLCASGPNGMTALHIAPSEVDPLGLFQRFPELIKATDNEGSTVLHTWVKFGCQFEGRDHPNPLGVVFYDFFKYYADDAVVLMHAIDRMDGNNPLHLTATSSTSTSSPWRVQIAEELISFYKFKRTHDARASTEEEISQEASASREVLSLNHELPWLMKNKNGHTPFLLAICKRQDELACCFLSFETMESLCSCDQNPLILAFNNECYQVAQKIVDMIIQYDDLTSLRSFEGANILHFASDCSVCGHEIYEKLLSRFPELIKATDNHGSTVLHTWVKMGCQCDKSEKVDRLKELIEYHFRHHTDDSLVLMHAIDEDGNNPLHVTATASNSFTLGPVQIAKQLIELYKSKRTSNASTSNQVLLPNNDLPWLMENKNGDTPLLLAVRNKREELVDCFLSVDLEGPLHSFIQNALILAINTEWFQVVDKIVEFILGHDGLASLLNFGGANILHCASRCSVTVIKEVVERFPSLISQRDNQGDTPVDKAAKDDAAGLVELMLKKDPLSLQKAGDGWKIACEKGHLYVILAFLEHCPYFRAFCIGVQDTPLHHIRLGSCPEYQQFLVIHKIIEELRHTRDAQGDTPLHKAINNDNTDLVEALLYMEDIRFDIKNRSGKTAMDLLVEKSKHKEWREMCEHVGIDLKLKTTYQQRETKLLNSRETLLVVATLLATITFQAGFTLPGGLNNNSGEAMFAKKPAFLVFLLTDVYVLCSSMLVLFYLLWSMVCDRSRSLELFDRSVMILWQSLYPSLVAFMSGVYIVISLKSLWAAIVTIVMCSLVGISATDSTILSDQLLDKLKLLLGKALKFKRGNSQAPSPATSTVSSEAATEQNAIV